MAGEGKRVMVVDDSVIAVAKLRVALETLGHEVVGSTDTGYKALDLYRSLSPDFVTMDITMPDMDGVEATRRILAEFPDALIIMVTSHGQERMVMDALKAGAVGYVLKPIKPDGLSASLAKIKPRLESQ